MSTAVEPRPDAQPVSGAAVFSDAWAARFAPWLLLVVGALLYLPRLGAFGLWDPSEVRVADAARVLLESNGVQAGRQALLNTWLIAEGFRRFGIGEIGGRLPLALCSIFAVLAGYYAGRAVLRPRAALLGALAMATMPGLVLGARQLTSGAPLTLCSTLAVGGLAHMLWPRASSGIGQRAFALVAALFGLAGGLFAAGALQGVVAPLLAVGVALSASPAGRLRGGVLLVVALGVTGYYVAAALHVGQYSPILGGAARAPQFQIVVTSVARALGFASMPWLAFAPFAILLGLSGEQPVPASDGARAVFSRSLLTAWLAALYVAATAHDAVVGELLPPAAAVLGLLAGAYLDAAIDWVSPRPLEGIAIGVLAVILAHDMLMTTDAFVSVNVADLVRWPAQIYSASNLLFGILALFALSTTMALVMPEAWRTSARVGIRAPRQLLLVVVVVQLAFAVAIVQWFLPLATKHLSPKDLYGKTKSLDPNAPLGQYRFNATGASYYMGGRTAKVLNTYDDVLNFLRQPERVFIFVGSEELAGIDQATRAGNEVVPYVVIDDSNSRFLIFSNRVGPNETDLNPLRRFVSDTAPTPQHPLAVNFDDKLQMLGYDLQAEAKRGDDVKVRLYFKVLAPVGGAYKVFLHFDGPNSRINGDHVPLDGRFPTQFWTVGTYVTDEYMLKPERATQPTGNYQLFFGLFTGDHRLKVKEGAADGENRVRLGVVGVN